MLPNGIQFSVFTATATSFTKHLIFDTLHLDVKNTFILEKSPVKSNLQFAVQYIGNEKLLEDHFRFLVDEIFKMGKETTKTLVFCQTRNQTSLLWRTLEFALGKNFYLDCCAEPKNRIVEMFHAGTPPKAKQFILEQVVQDDSHMRVLICTVAFGMGVNCQGVHRIIHFGASGSIESYIQERGRAGRDGLPRLCLLLFNGMLLSKSDEDMKRYVYSKACRREELSNLFPVSKNSKEPRPVGCECCDVCADECSCRKDDCGSKKLHLHKLTREKEKEPERKRPVNALQVTELKGKLQEFKWQREDSLMQAPESALYPNIQLQFTDFQINQICSKCDILFTVDGIRQNVEIWRSKDAAKVLECLTLFWLGGGQICPP